jgi:hypothetical protein
MRQNVKDIWLRFSAELEGRVHILYLDKKGLVSTAIGNMIPNPDELCNSKYPFRHGWAGNLADCNEKKNGWNVIKGKPPNQPAGRTKDEEDNSVYGKACDLRLSDEAIDSLVWAKTAMFENALRAEFPGYDNFPSDAQLGLLSMAWPGSFLGPFFPKFKEDVRNGWWFAAARDCHFGEPDKDKRNRYNRWAFGLAGRAIKVGGLDKERLYFNPPGTLNYGNTGANKVYFTKGSKYIRFDWDDDKMDEGYNPPGDLSSWNLPEPFSKGVDAALNGLGDPKVPEYFGLTLFIRGSNVIEYDWDLDKPYEAFPLYDFCKTEDFANGIDAALNGEGKWFGKYFMFKGSRFVQIDWATQNLDFGPAEIGSFWHVPAPFSQGIDAAVSGQGKFSGRFYFFKDDNYVRCNWKDPISVDYTKPIAEGWRGLSSVGFDRGVKAPLNPPGGS